VRIAFYAPLKAPDHPVPSGDRRMAQLLMAALAAGGHEVTLAARFRSREGAGDPARQQRIAAVGGRIADRLIARARRDPGTQPALWFTYHLYYKAPDWLGPRIAAALGIPYVVAEASVAGKRAGGPWDQGHRAVLETLAAAAAVVGLNSADREGVEPALASPGRWFALKPFLDPAPFIRAGAERAASRAALAAAHGLDPAQPWLIAVAMMRPGDKLASYGVLGEALALLSGEPWQLLVVGDGPAHAAVAAALAPVAARCFRLGAAGAAALPALLAAADVAVWPAINEAYGMALLEAQAAGVPVVAGASGGVADIVADGRTGALAPPGDAPRFAAALAPLLTDPGRRAAYGRAAQQRVRTQHDITAAARCLDALLAQLVTPRAA
jgi:glycosyltransferase involved in cell wall biosynthesis